MSGLQNSLRLCRLTPSTGSYAPRIGGSVDHTSGPRSSTGMCMARATALGRFSVSPGHSGPRTRSVQQGGKTTVVCQSTPILTTGRRWRSCRATGVPSSCRGFPEGGCHDGFEWERRFRKSLRRSHGLAVASLERTRMRGAFGSWGWGRAVRANCSMTSGRKTRHSVEPPNWK